MFVNIKHYRIIYLLQEFFILALFNHIPNCESDRAGYSNSKRRVTLPRLIQTEVSNSRHQLSSYLIIVHVYFTAYYFYKINTNRLKYLSNTY